MDSKLSKLVKECIEFMDRRKKRELTVNKYSAVIKMHKITKYDKALIKTFIDLGKLPDKTMYKTNFPVLFVYSGKNIKIIDNKFENQ